jgi:hypothetical protein
MPHLAADALLADPQGLAFLRTVLAPRSDRAAGDAKNTIVSNLNEPDVPRPVARPERAPVRAVPPLR